MKKNNIFQEACKEEHYNHEGFQLAHSGFNLNWFNEYKINPKVIIEFGSFDGGDGLRYKLAYPKCDVYSIEADPQLFGKTEQLKKYELKVFNYAICDINGEIDFHRCLFKEPYYCYQKGDVGGSGSILKPSEYNKEVVLHQFYEEWPIIVKAITVETFCIEQKINEIDLMHIDVEGAAMEVLSGFGCVRPKLLFIEIDGAEKFYESASRFDEVNFVLEKMEYELKFRSRVDCLYVKRKIG